MNTDSTLKNQTQIAKLINLKANEARRAAQQMQTPRTLLAPTVLRRVAAHG